MTRNRGLCAAALLLAILSVAACAHKPSSTQRQTWTRELAQLQAEQDSLQQRAAVLVSEDSRIQNLPKGDVVIAVPTAFLTSVVERLFSDVVSNVHLSVRGIRVHSEQAVKKVVTIGEFTIDVDIMEITGRLRPGKPEIAYGGDQISLLLPIEVTEGHGEAKIHFVWDGKRAAGATCGDMDVTQNVSGDVIPTTYAVSGALALAFEGNQVIGVPTFPETKLNIRVRPSQASWDAIHALLEEKGGLCGWVLDKVNVPNILTNVVEKKGFNVKLPLQKIKPLSLPAGISETVKVGERTLALSVQTNTLRIDPDAIWYSASVALASAPSIAEAPVPGL